MTQPEKKTRPVTLDKWKFEIEEYAEGGEVNLGVEKYKVGIGWMPHGGVVLRNVYHGGFRMAYELGVVGVWVFPGAKARADGQKAKYLVLGPPDFIQLDESYKIMKPEQGFDAVRRVKAGEPYEGFSSISNQNVYNSSVKGELIARWRSNSALFGKESGHLFVTQRFILTDYDAEPAHEPTGGLLAARLHPITEIHYEHPNKGYVESFRVDYRIYANLDSWWYRRPGKTTVEDWMFNGDMVEGRDPKAAGKIDNSAGLFRDDDLAMPGYSGFSLADAASYSAADVVFEAAEKPLKYEVIADGINPGLGDKVWDNIHWWGVNVKKGSVTPSAPGAFHALHMHWRWSMALQRGVLWTPAHAGEQQFKGRGPRGILVDPRINKQKLRLAVVLNKGLPENLHEHSSEDFEEFFKRSRVQSKSPEPRNVPSDIQRGGDLALYYSAEVPAVDRSYIPACNAWSILEGEVFVHGMFFAHEPEKSTIYAGPREPMYERPSEPHLPRSWVRNPQT